MIDKGTSVRATDTLPWNTLSRAVVCPGCPDHRPGSGGDRYELALEGAPLDGGVDHHDVLRLVRRSPDVCSGPFDIVTPPDTMQMLAVVDYLERQTFDASEAGAMARTLAARFPAANIHVWSVGRDISLRIAEDAAWLDEEGLLVRSPTVDIPPEEYPMDVGWRDRPEIVSRPDGRTVELWRGCLYVEPLNPDLVRYGWVDFPGLRRGSETPDPGTRAAREIHIPATRLHGFASGAEDPA